MDISPEAQNILSASGWNLEGFDEKLAEKLVRQLHKAQRRRRDAVTEAFPEAMNALASYGGIVIPDRGAGITAYRDGFNLIPVEGLTSETALQELRQLTAGKERFFPIGAIPDIHGKLLIGNRGRIVMYGPNGYFLMGDDMNEALNNLIAGVEPGVFFG
ncbi:SUKH-3 domain-containing protein [Streptomyces sp. McG3]|uniref:SUKH-3 domain-containing protein n=1 Tax=Streptomyces sp. McG3 TaxID=2725483 RepID=UPI001BEC1241|nr:SUKH-3 domain-containing protein [Streptomyces sp. McG3]MBT2901916.1 hypothetical protein [Streptomyces sp. McG3]